MVSRIVTFVLLAGAFAATAHAAGRLPAVARGATSVELMPRVTYEQGVQFTPHGAVAFHVITAPRPGSANGLYALAPTLARSTVVGGRARVTQMQKELSAQATTAGINGDLFNEGDSHPTGIYIEAASSSTHLRAPAPRSASTAAGPSASTASSSSARGGG